MVDGLGIIGAGLAFGLAALGTAIGQGIAGASAIAAVSEDPKMLVKSLIFVGIAETATILGFIIALIILFVI